MYRHTPSLIPESPYFSRRAWVEIDYVATGGYFHGDLYSPPEGPEIELVELRCEGLVLPLEIATVLLGEDQLVLLALEDDAQQERGYHDDDRDDFEAACLEVVW